MDAGDIKSAELVARLERLPFSRWHRNLFVLCFLGVMFDACDFALFGMALVPWSLYIALRGRYVWVRSIERASLWAAGIILLLLLIRWGIVLL